MSAGHSIAVQNFNENTSILVMIALYSLLLSRGYSIYFVITAFGLFVAGTMAVVQPGTSTTAGRTAPTSSACWPSRGPRTLTRVATSKTGTDHVSVQSEPIVFRAKTRSAQALALSGRFRNK